MPGTESRERLRSICRIFDRSGPASLLLPRTARHRSGRRAGGGVQLAKLLLGLSGIVGVRILLNKRAEFLDGTVDLPGFDQRHALHQVSVGSFRIFRIAL